MAQAPVYLSLTRHKHPIGSRDTWLLREDRFTAGMNDQGSRQWTPQHLRSSLQTASWPGVRNFMFSQHAKWLKVTKKPPWRRDIASLNGLLADGSLGTLA